MAGLLGAIGRAAVDTVRAASNASKSSSSSSSGGGGRTLSVGSDGRAPSSARVGDVINTAGGSFRITGGTPGNWTSERVGGSSGGGSIGANFPGSASGIKAANAEQQALLNKMNQNSILWHQSNTATQSKLAAENMGLASQLSAMGLQITRGADGLWRMSGTATPAQQQMINNMGVPTEQNAYGNPQLIGLGLGDMYGLNYDYDKILGMLNEATQKSYAAQREQAKTTENQFYNRLSDTQATALDTLRKSQAQAVATGASKGIAAANQLSSMLNLQNTATTDATTLANASNLLGSQEQAAMAKNASSALETSNAVKQAIASIDQNKYGYDVQQLIGKLDYLASQYSANKTLEGVKYNADANLAGTRAQAAATFNSNSGGGSSRSYSSYYGGYKSNGGRYLSGGSSTGNTGVVPAGAKVVDGGTTTFDDFMKSGDNYYSAGNTVIIKNANGTYDSHSIVDGKDDYQAGLSQFATERIINNEGDVKAGNLSYGASEFVKEINDFGKRSGGITVDGVKKVDNKTTEEMTFQDMEKFKAAHKGEKWEWKYDKLGWVGTLKNQSTYDAAKDHGTNIKDGTYVRISGTDATSRKNDAAYTYDAKRGVWKDSWGKTLSVPAMNKLLSERKQSGDYKVSITTGK